MTAQHTHSTSYPIPQTPFFARIDLIDRSRLWVSTRALQRTADVSQILSVLDCSGWLFADQDGGRAWYGLAYDPDLDDERSGAELCLILLSLSVSPDATPANFHFDRVGSC